MLLKVGSGGRCDFLRLSLSMNFLAHAYLSFNNSPVLLGNMISDFVKGKKQYDYPALIQAGIRLHREIDHFTDSHECTHELKKFFQQPYRLYSGAFVDVVYDYFLANDRNEFADDDALLAFSETTYQLLQDNERWQGEQFGRMFPHMRSQNWLYNYRTQQGIRNSFEGLRRRAAYITEADTGFSIFTENLTAMQPFYHRFFPDVKNFAAGTLAELLQN